MHNREKAFYLFFKENFIPVTQFIGRYSGMKEEAMDIAQEGFLRVYEKWDTFSTPENARAFLYTITRNLCLDDIKHQKARTHYLSHFRPEDQREEAFFLKEVTRQETFRIINAAIDSLPGQSRQVIRLSMEGASVNEVAEQLKVSVNTVKTLKKNAYSALRRKLSPDHLALLYIFKEKK